VSSDLTHIRRPRLLERLIAAAYQRLTAGLDPNAGMLEWAQRKAGQLGLRVQLVDRGAEELPFADGTFDMVCLRSRSAPLPIPPRRCARRTGYFDQRVGCLSSSSSGVESSHWRPGKTG
jgi:SAM-dependent methyltransferase